MLDLKLKCLPSDFIVQEVAAPDMVISKEQDDYEYYLMSKFGYTTFEALNLLALHAGISAKNLGYLGLKDEDGLTTQYISIHKCDAKKLNDKLPHLKIENQEKFISLKYFSSNQKPLKIGELIGNAFSLKIRNLSKEILSSLEKKPLKGFLFVNYYGRQRFSLPGGPLNTHLIGQFFYQKKYKEAIIELSKQPSELGETAKKFLIKSDIDEKELIDKIEKRMLAFFMSSYFASLWNTTLKEQLLSIKHHKNDDFDPELSFIYNTDLFYEMLPKSIPYVRVEYNHFNESFEEKNLQRLTTVQVNPTIKSIEEDNLHPNKICITMDFFIPSGCYATVFVPQLLGYIHKRDNLN